MLHITYTTIITTTTRRQTDLRHQLRQKFPTTQVLAMRLNILSPLPRKRRFRCRPVPFRRFHNHYHLPRQPTKLRQLQLQSQQITAVLHRRCRKACPSGYNRQVRLVRSLYFPRCRNHSERKRNEKNESDHLTAF